MSIIRNCAVGLVIGAAILLSPLAAWLIVISAELAVDSVAQAGVPGIFDLAIAGALGWMMFSRILSRHSLAPQSEPEPVISEPGVPPG